MDKPIEPPPASLRDPATDSAGHWTPARMAEFLRCLVATQSVSEAARGVGMSRQSAYRLRARFKGQPFDIAWEAAFQHCYDELAQAALERATHGVEMPIFRGGEQVGTYRKYDERLTCFLLAQRNSVGALHLGRHRAPAEFWSHRWDEIVDLVGTGLLRWPDNEDRPYSAGRLSKQDRMCVQAVESRHLPDRSR
jgi:hypothetical protein